MRAWTGIVRQESELCVLFRKTGKHENGCVLRHTVLCMDRRRNRRAGGTTSGQHGTLLVPVTVKGPGPVLICVQPENLRQRRIEAQNRPGTGSLMVSVGWVSGAR